MCNGAHLIYGGEKLRIGVFLAARFSDTRNDDEYQR